MQFYTIRRDGREFTGTINDVAYEIGCVTTSLYKVLKNGGTCCGWTIEKAENHEEIGWGRYIKNQANRMDKMLKEKGKRINDITSVDEKSVLDFINGQKDLKIGEYLEIAREFDLSGYYLITGEKNEEDEA